MRRLTAPLLVALTLLAGAPGARAGTSTPPPTPVPVPCPGGSGVCVSPSPFPTVLNTPPASTDPPDLDAAAAVLEDLETGQILFAQDPDAERSLASTTKIMTALLVLRRADPTDVVTVGDDAAAEGRAGAGFSELGLLEGERISVQDLLFALMLQSSNDAAIALADHVSGSEDAFVEDMNGSARDMGLEHTVFYSPNGLDDRGHSTPREMAEITRAAMAVPELARIVGAKFDTIPAPSGPDRRVQNRNVLLWLYAGGSGVKTGYTSAAGFCLVATAKRAGRGLVAVVLGDPSSQDSFDDAAALLDYGFTAYTEKTLVQRGQTFPAVPVGTQRIPVEAARGLERLLPAAVAAGVHRTVRILPGVVLPVGAGDRIGTISFRSGGLAVGSVPLVAAGAPEGEAGSASGTPWWVRGVGGAVELTLDAFFGLFG